MTNRWVFIPGTEFPDEAKEGLAGWRATINKSQKKGKKWQYKLHFKGVEQSRGEWYSEDLIKKLRLLSD